MKICDITQLYSPISGGIKTYLHNKRKYIRSKPNVQHILIVPWHKNTTKTDAGLKTYNVKSPKLPFSESYRFFISFRKILKIMDREKPDIIEVGDPYIAGLLSIIYGKKKGIPVVGFYHSDIPNAIKRSFMKFLPECCYAPFQFMLVKYLKFFYSGLSKTIVTTPYFQEYLENIGIGNVVKYSFGVDSDYFYPVNSKDFIFDKYCIPTDAKLLVYAGRIAREKNIDLLTSVSKLISKFKVYLIVIGDGEQRKMLEKISADNPRIIYLNYIKDKNFLRELYSAADLFVHAGMSETFGLSLLEAQACGADAVAFKNSGLDYVIYNKDNLVGKFCPELMAVKIEQILQNNPSLDGKFRISDVTCAKFDNVVFFDSLMKEYTKALEGFPYNELLLKQYKGKLL